MKNFIFGLIAGLFIAASICATTINPNIELIEAVKQYHKGTEELLDELEMDYNWVDGYDNYDYYEGRDKVEELLSLEE